MATTIGVRFPLGRYHATPWDRSVNEGATEWPPSPWRVLRALVATWHTRWPELPAAVFDELLAVLGGQPSYWTPPGRPAHTRHYLPGLDHKKGEPGGTDLTLDPFLWLGRDDDPETELLIQWPANLDDEQRAALAKLTELLPYLGRADSVCQARLLDTSPVPDESWWRPGAHGQRHCRLLAPAQPVSRATLEISADQVRRQRRTMPPGTTWVDYAKPTAVRHRISDATAATIEAVRFAVTGPAPLTASHGVLLADAAHRVAGHKLTGIGVSDRRRSEILGSGGAATGHGHAHWVPLAEGGWPGAAVKALVLWVPHGLRPDEVAGLISLGSLSGRLGGQGYEVRGFPSVRLLFQGAGTPAQMAPELRGPARVWQSLTPYLPVRHRKREALPDFLAADVRTELRYRRGPHRRTWPTVTVTPTGPEAGLPDRWTREFRRYRLSEHMNKSRPGLGLRLVFAEEVTGPLLLGQLSHFGYGIFMPEGR